MKIAILHHDLSIRSGAQRLVLGLGSGLEARGHSVAYYTAFYDKDSAYPSFKGKRMIAAGGRRDFLGRFRGLSAYFTSRRVLKKGLETFRPEALILSTSYYLASDFKPSIIYCHFPERHLLRGWNPVRRLLHLPIDIAERRGFQRADQIICNSNYTRIIVEKTFSKSCIVAHPGVDTQRFKFAQEDEGYLLTVNRISPTKNLELAISTAKLLSERGVEVKLVVAGSLEERYRGYYHSLLRLVEAWGLSGQVEFRVNLTEEELLNTYSGCSIFLYTPLGEHFGFGPVEAMACGKPVVVVKGGGPSETVLDGETGFVVEAEPRLWAEAVMKLQRDAELRRRFGGRGREWVQESFTWDGLVSRVEKVCRELTT